MRPLEPLEAVVGKVEEAASLDGSVETMRRAVDTVLPSPAVKDALHGVRFGHPLHPALIIAPLGTWISATVLDLLPGNRRAAQRLIGLGVLATVPTAVTGAADWSGLPPKAQRTGLVHAAGNGAALALQVASWRARRRGRHGRGVVLSLAALSLGGASAYLGGHLAYRQLAGVEPDGTVRIPFPAEG